MADWPPGTDPAAAATALPVCAQASGTSKWRVLGGARYVPPASHLHDSPPKRIVEVTDETIMIRIEKDL